MKGYKVFNPDWTCNPSGIPFQYEVGKVFEENVTPSTCSRGFHFCQVAADCFNYYSFDSKNKVAEVEALGEVATEGNKSCTNKIHIIREITWQELLTLVNTGRDCTGLGNSGDRNSGDWNSGNRNSGDGNSGDWNSGDWNSGNGNSGCFNTDAHKIVIFDKPSGMTLDEWRRSDAYYILNRIDFRPTDWIWSDDMTDKEKKEHPEYETTCGYLKENDTKDCRTEWWNGLTVDEKCIIQNIKNFDAEKFEQITGIKVDFGGKTMEKKIIAILKDLGMPAGNLGFKYMKDGVLAAVEDESVLQGMTKDGLYSVVAKKNGSTVSRVERAIRHGIETVFAKCDKDTLTKYFGRDVDHKPTNRNFLAALVNEVKED